MRTVSKTYKEHIHDPIRNSVFMEINIGLINREAQESASISSPLHRLSNKDVFSRDKVQLPYATYEENFFKVDGKMLLPKESGTPKYYNAYISNEMSDENGDIQGCKLIVSFPQSAYPLDIKGLTLQFYCFYPLSFDIAYNDKVITFENDGLNFSTNYIFESLSTPIQIIPRKMSSPHARFRIENIKFGIGVEFTSRELISASLETYTHPICNNLPYKNLSFTVDDRESLYDLENPKSSINFMEQMQDVQVRMGFELPNKSIEWIDMETLSLQEWISEKNKATFKACDVLSFNDNEYYKGQYYPNGISLYDLAINVLLDMGMEHDRFVLDSYLKTIMTKNPIPVCKHKEALQIIANAGRCYMSQDKDGKLYIMSNFIPEYEISSGNKMPYANLQNVHDGIATEYYATFEDFSMPIDGSLYLAPNNAPHQKKIGYVSNTLSGNEGKFTTPVLVTIQAEARLKTFGLFIKFGLSTATNFTVETYRDNVLAESITYENDETEWRALREWKEFDRMDIYVNSVGQSNQRVYIDHIKFGDVTDYYISDHEYKETTPRGVLDTKVQNLLVSTTNYSKTDVEEKLVDKDVVYGVGQEDELITFSAPVFGLRAEGCTIVESGVYYALVRKPKVTTKTSSHIIVYGKKYNVTTNTLQYKVNEKGTDQPFENPLIDTLDNAYTLAEWLADYVRENKNYTFDWRGDMTVESNDLIYVQNTFLPKMKLRVLKNVIDYNGGVVGGRIEGRKVGDA